MLPAADAPDDSGGPERWAVASESCAFDIIGARFHRDVAPGEIVTLDERGLRSRLLPTSVRPALCVFEYIYFARPDSRMNGHVLQVVRARMGEILWREAPVDADLVIAVPDSGNAAARGLARAAGLPQDDGFVKNRYVARTFIQPGQELRRHGLRLKFNPLPEVIAGKRLVVVDDSIVRGNTTRQIVQMLRDSGAREIHMRISAPPIVHPCHYGIDMSTREEMIAHGRTSSEIAAELGCDSLHYLSLDGVYEAIGAGAGGAGGRAGLHPTATRASAVATPSTGRARRTASMRWRRARSRRARRRRLSHSCGRRRGRRLLEQRVLARGRGVAVPVVVRALDDHVAVPARPQRVSERADYDRCDDDGCEHFFGPGFV